MLGKTLAGRYKLTRILGAGGFGQTYLAIDTHQRQIEGHGKVETVQIINQCVVKQLQPASQDANFLSVARRLFETEANTLKRLGFHKQIPQLLDSFEEDSEFYLVQEYIDGQSLEDEIKELGQLSEAEVIDLLEDVLSVLQFIHDNHVVHRDLKPDNLIRRRDNGKIVLIDFGAVKEIRTKLLTGEQTALTIGIGTQGYTPSEQLSGKPRYSSDIYALGMTAIHALTGRSPTDLPEDLDSLDPHWQAYAEASPGLSLLLSKMTRHYIYQRYSRVEDVLRDLSRLEELPAEAASAPTYLETSIPEDRLIPPAPTILRWRMGKRSKKLTVAIATLLTSAFVLGLRQMGAFVPSELAAHDWLVSQQKDLGPDDRLLLIGVEDSDMQSLGGVLSDEALAIALENLQRHDPAVVGIEMLRGIPQAPGTERLQQQLQASNIVVSTRLGSFSSGEFVPPPSGVSLNQISFNDIVRDSDFRVRRSLMLAAFPTISYKPISTETASTIRDLAIESSSAENSNIENSNIENSNIENSRTEDSNIENSANQTNIENSNIENSNIENSSTEDSNIENSANQTNSVESSSNVALRSAASDDTEVRILSFAAELATRYLAAQHTITAENTEILQFGDIKFKPISSTFGAYKREDTSHYQIFTDYRSQFSVAPTITLEDLLSNNFDTALVKNKIVLIGYTYSRDNNLFLTAYSTGSSREQMPSVVIQAHAISQIISSVLDSEPVPWTAPDWAEVVWIISLTGIGSTLMVLSQRAVVLITFGVSGLVVSCLVSVISFQLGGWVPMTAPMSAFFLSAAGARISKSYQRRYWEARQ